MKKVLERLNKMKLWQQILLVLVIVGGSFLLFFMNTRPDGNHLLYSQLDATEAVEIGAELDKMGVAYTLSEENTVIQVQTPDVAHIRMKMAEMGLPSENGSGFELFDSNQLGASSFENDVNYTRALTTEIQKDLVAGIEGIASANVQIPLIEKKRFFEDDSEELTATIIVEEKSQVTLDEVQVKGIQNFVAGAVKDLLPEHVTVLNQKGEIISENGTEGASLTGSYGKQEEIKIQMEERIRKDIAETMDSVFGYDNVKLTIRTDINFDEIVQNIEKYDPEGTLVSKQESRESVTQRNEPDLEVGMETGGDVVDYEQTDGNQGTLNESQKEELIENFEVGKTVETIRKNPELQNTLVSVYVDEREISVDKLADLEESIALSAGLIDKDKDGLYDNGDISVKPYEFKKTPVEEVEEVEEVVEKKNFLQDNLLFVIVLVLLLLIIIGLGVMLFLLSRNKKKQAEKEREEQIRQQEEAAKVAEETVEMSPMTKEEKIKARILEETVKLSQENPEKTIEYIRKSINER